mgnify:CR=1 FL=1
MTHSPGLAVAPVRWEVPGPPEATDPAVLRWMTDYQEDVRWFGGLRLARQRPVVKGTKEYIEENYGIRVEYVDSIDGLLTDLRLPEETAVTAVA